MGIVPLMALIKHVGPYINHTTVKLNPTTPAISCGVVVRTYVHT